MGKEELLGPRTEWTFIQGSERHTGFNWAGAIKFDYGAKTIRAGISVDEAEGRMIVDWLRPKLPQSATDAAV